MFSRQFANMDLIWKEHLFLLNVCSALHKEAQIPDQGSVKFCCHTDESLWSVTSSEAITSFGMSWNCPNGIYFFIVEEMFMNFFNIQTSRATEPIYLKLGLHLSTQWDIHKSGFKYNFYCCSSCKEHIVSHLELQQSIFD